MGSDKCPGCLRYIGAADPCPFCDADAEDAHLLKWLRRGALLVAVYGVIWMILAARQTELPLSTVAALDSAALPRPVRIEGRVTEAFRAHDGSFLVADPTGSVRIYTGPGVARTLGRSGRLPEIGMRISVTAMSISSGSAASALRLQTADALTIHPHIRPERETRN